MSPGAQTIAFTHNSTYMDDLTPKCSSAKTAKEQQPTINNSLKSNLKSSIVSREILPGRLEV
jgi:hypothetical protein